VTLRLALVEDNADNRLLVHALLDERYALTDYETGMEALAGIPALRPDLVLLDVSLPEMDGTEVLRRLRADPALAAVPVVAVTAHAMAGDRERYLALGFDDYVTKPIVDEQLLFDAIARHLGG
jgi:two-component system cell cycle response regulator DivK